MKKNNSVTKTVIFAGVYEQVTKSDTVTRLYYMPGGMYVKQTKGSVVLKDGMYYVHPDHLGSVPVVTDATGNIVQKCTFDAWGRRLFVTKDRSLIFDRGFTGHEHLDEFGLINMNGRMYDPIVGRFLSPDPYVQDTEFSQSFNRYSYCWNNPLVNTDPDGEFVHLIVGAAMGGLINLMMNADNIHTFWQGLGYFGVGALAGALSAGIGTGVNVAMAGGSFGAGFMGTAVGISSTGFIAGAATGAVAGFTGGFVTNSGNAWFGGANFGEGLWKGVKGGGIGALAGGVLGGTIGGIDALTKRTNFWTGKGTFDLSKAYGANGTAIGDKTVSGKYVGKFEGINLYEAPIPNGSAATLPGRGIILSKGYYTSNPNAYGVQELLQHEFGHILQAREVGLKAFYDVIAKESLASATLDQITNGVWNHNSFWTETWANYLSNGYFGTKSLLLNNPTWWPAQDISWFNLLRLRASSPLFFP